MIRVYYLPVERADETDGVKGMEHIHNAILECTEKPDVRKLIMDTTTGEDITLSALALEVREPTQEETNQFANLEIETPTRDLATEIDNLKARVENLEKRRS